MKKIVISLFAVITCIFAMAFNVSADEWVKTEKGYKYQYDDGTYAKQGWLNLNGKKYYITKSGVRKKGWLTTKNGTKYYFGKDGSALKGLYKIGDTKYYFDENCKMVTGDVIIKDYMYYFDSDGKYMSHFKLDEFQKKLRIYNIWIYDIDSVGGVDVSIGWENMSDKTVKYIYFTVKPINAVGDTVKCEITKDSTVILSETGPFEKNEGNYYYEPITKSEFGSTWANVWYNNTVHHVNLEKVKIEYMDGTTTTISGWDLQSVYY